MKPLPTSSVKSPGRAYQFLPYMTVGIIVVCAFLSAFGMELLGDDLNHGMRTAEKFPHWYQWPLAIPYQWLTGNGRFGDMMGNILLAHSPMWLLASLSAVMEGLFYAMAMKLSFPRRDAVLPRLSVLAVIMFAFPWWDSFFLFVCRFNYIWSAALTLLTLWISLFRQGKELKAAWCFLLVPLALAAGWGHEACGMPIVAGLAVYFYISRNLRSLPKPNRYILLAFCIGSILSITSPCSYSRLGTERVPDDILPVLLLKSSFIALLLILTVAAICCFPSGRKRILSLCRTPWIVFTTGALCSMVFVAAGGVVGRSGVFSQMYALIAMGMLIRNFIGNYRICTSGVATRILSLILFLIMAIHECGVCAYQIEGNRQLRLCRRLYEESADGVVFASPMQRNEFPWWTLRKNKACVDNDDGWLIEVYDFRLGHDKKHYRLLPEALKKTNVTHSDLEVAGLRGSIVREKPHGTSTDNLLTVKGVVYTVVEFNADDGDTLFYVAPRILDPGDR